MRIDSLVFPAKSNNFVMTKTSIRSATITDIPFIVPLMSDLGYPCDDKTLKKRFVQFIKLNGYGVAVACYDSDIVGFIAWSQSNLFALDAKRLHIEALIVNTEFRKQNTGSKLIKFVEEKAKLLNLPVIIDLTSSIKREKHGVHNFYTKLGFRNEGNTAKVYLRKCLNKYIDCT